jgi:amidase
MLQAAGYEVDEVDPPLVSETLQCFDDIVTAEMADTLGPLLPKFPDGMMNASVRFMQERAVPVTLGSYMAALRQRDHLVRQWQNFMQTYPVILLPPCLSVSMPVRPAETADLNVRELYQQLPALRMAPLLGFPAARR